MGRVSEKSSGGQRHRNKKYQQSRPVERTYNCSIRITSERYSLTHLDISYLVAENTVDRRLRPAVLT
jgi:hypothetical protein